MSPVMFFIHCKDSKTNGNNAIFAYMTDDRKLSIELSKGSKQAFETLYLRYSYLVERFVYSLVKDRNATDDITQNVFLNLWSRRANLSKDIAFRSYLFTSSKNAVIDWFRRRDKLQTEAISTGLTDLPTADTEKVLDDAELLTLINLAISNMPEKRKRIFTLSRVDGLRNAEIARQMGISEKTVEYHISKALEELRKLTYIIALFV